MARITNVSKVAGNKCREDALGYTQHKDGNDKRNARKAKMNDNLFRTRF